MKTKAILLDKIGHVSMQEVEIPSIRDHEVLVKIDYAGICGSQINEIYGIKGEDKYLPHLLGHEACGKVEEVGKEVTKVKIGDYVLCTWIKTNGKEDGAKKYGDYNAGAITTLQEYSVISENRIIKVECDINKLYLPMYACTIPTALGCLEEIDHFGKNILVIGTGNIGLVILSVLNHYCNLYYIESNPNKRDFIKEHFSIKPYDENVKYDYIIDTVASNTLINELINWLAFKGKYILIGNTDNHIDSTFNIMHLVVNSNTIVGRNTSQITEDTLRHYMDVELDYDDFNIKFIKFDEAIDILNDLDKCREKKYIISIQ